MSLPDPAERPRKRRAINACVPCRSSKVRCDGKQPCERCDRNDAVCHYRDVSEKDQNTVRIESLEAEVARLQAQVNAIQQATMALPTEATRIGVSSNLTQTRDVMNTRPVGINAAEKGIITYDNAFTWFSSFFAGSHYLVPIFSESNDVIASVATRSAFLFDAIVSVGCRAEQGFNSPIFRQLQFCLKGHLTHVLVACEQPNIEAVQAIALMAAYSENGHVLIALALRFATQLELHKATDRVLALPHDGDLSSTERSELYRLARVWHGICNLELL